MKEKKGWGIKLHRSEFDYKTSHYKNYGNKECNIGTRVYVIVVLAGVKAWEDEAERSGTVTNDASLKPWSMEKLQLAGKFEKPLPPWLSCKSSKSTLWNHHVLTRQLLKSMVSISLPLFYSLLTNFVLLLSFLKERLRTVPGATLGKTQNTSAHTRQLIVLWTHLSILFNIWSVLFKNVKVMKERKDWGLFQINGD